MGGVKGSVRAVAAVRAMPWGEVGDGLALCPCFGMGCRYWAHDPMYAAQGILPGPKCGPHGALLTTDDRGGVKEGE